MSARLSTIRKYFASKNNTVIKSARQRADVESCNLKCICIPPVGWNFEKDPPLQRWNIVYNCVDRKATDLDETLGTRPGLKSGVGQMLEQKDRENVFYPKQKESTACPNTEIHSDDLNSPSIFYTSIFYQSDPPRIEHLLLLNLCLSREKKIRRTKRELISWTERNIIDREGEQKYRNEYPWPTLDRYTYTIRHQHLLVSLPHVIVLVISQNEVWRGSRKDIS